MAAKKYIEIDIDSSEFQEIIDRMRAVMTPQQFENAMHGIMKRVPSKVKSILGTDIPHEYNVRQAEVRSTVGGGRTTAGGGGAGCVIPVRGPRKHIGGGGRGFPAWGKLHGWETLWHKPYKVQTMVYRGQRSTLPMNLSDYGGQKPFRNVPSSLNGITFTRGGKPRLPILPVMGIAVPQMPLNRSEPEVQEDIANYLMERMEHRLQALVLNGR